MPILPEEEEDSPEDLDSSSSSPVTNTPPIESRVVTMTLSAPSIVFPRLTNQDPQPLDQARPHSPRQRLPKKPLSSGNPVTTVDSKGHVIDLVKDQLPDMHLSEEDRQKNRELLEEAKRVSERFHTRRGRKSLCSLSDSSAGASPSLTPRSSPSPSRSSSLTTLPQAVADATDATSQSSRKATDWSEKLRVSSEAPTGGSVEHGPSREREISPVAAVVKVEEEVEEEVGSRPGNHKRDSQPHATGVSRLAPRAPCTAEIKTIGAFPPLMSAVSWDSVGSIPTRAGVQGLSPQGEEPPSPTLTGLGDFPVPPIKMQKLAKLREENKLVRNQSISGSKLPDLSETAEQERGSLEDSGERVDVMPNISDVMLRKLKMHRAQMGSAPPLTEKEVENAFVQLSLAFRNDNYTLETRLRQAERERHLTEENTEKELAEVMCVLQGTGGLWQHSGQREAYHRLLETLEVLRRLATRLSSRAEMVGAVRQEKRMNKATEVMMQYVENLKRTYEKDHAELTEFKKLANQNSSRCYAGSIDTDDGVPRATRSMSLTLGKALPRRRVSVAVVPKFNLLNIPGQTAVTSRPALPVLCETNSVKCFAPVEPSEQRVPAGGKSLGIQERGALAVTRPSEETEEIRNEVRAKMEAKMEEDAYNKGYQEGLRRSKELQELQEMQEKEVTDNSPKIQEEKEEDMTTERRRSSKYKAIDLLDQLCPTISRHNQTHWIILTLIAVTFFVVSVFTYFRDYGQVEDGSSAESLGPGKNKLFDWTTAKNQPKNPGLE